MSEINVGKSTAEELWALHGTGLDHNELSFSFFTRAIRAFGDNTTIMFEFSDEDMDHVEKHGELPEGAKPIRAVIASAGHPIQNPIWAIGHKLEKLGRIMQDYAVSELEMGEDAARRTYRYELGSDANSIEHDDAIDKAMGVG